MASFDTLQILAQHPEWIAPRSDLRVFIGEPGAPEATKTTLEPGNVFSPGMRTFGVTWWLRRPDTGQFFATETAPLTALQWRYEDGYLPLIHCDSRFEALAIHHEVFQDGTAQERTESVCAALDLTNTDTVSVEVQVFIALRSLGPAGGPLADLQVAQDRHSFQHRQDDLPLLAFDQAASGIGCGVGDPSTLALHGETPLSPLAEDKDGWCFGLARFDITLAQGQQWRLRMECPLHTYGNLAREMPSRALVRLADFDSRRAQHVQAWRTRLHTLEISVPDADFRNAFFAGVQHMLTASVGDQARIAPLSYPLPWLRDSVYIIRCLDLVGLHEAARGMTEYCSRNDFFGGFGAEGDAPGQGIWALVQHYRLTQDKAWLRHVYPAIQRKCDWLFRMRRTEQPIQITTDTPVLAFTHAERAAGVICLAAQDGIIMGSMDHGVSYALGWVNHWALCGLQEAAFAAHELNFTEDTVRYEDEREALQQAFTQFITQHPDLFTQERTVNSLLWPTNAWSHAVEQVHQHFMRWWGQNRVKHGQFVPEPYWLYFELAQAHNALLMGEIDLVWQVLDYRLRHADLPGLYGLREGGDGVGTENAVYGVTLINQLRGCHKFDSITPHGWSQAELWLLQRAVLVEEWAGGLLLFAGVPTSWLIPNARIDFRHFPTAFGRISAELTVDATGQQGQVSVSGAAEGTPLSLRLNGQTQHAAAQALSTSFQLTIDRFA